MALFFVFGGFSGVQMTFAQSMKCETPEEKVKCQAELAAAEAEAKAAQAQLNSAQSQSASLKQAIAVLDAKIKVAQANIKAKNLLIQTLGNDITQKQRHINNLEEHITKGKETLAVILRKTNELDANSLPEVILSQSSVTGFFQDLDTFESVHSGLQSTFDKLQADEKQTEAEKQALEVRQNTEMDAKYVIQQEQKKIQSDQTQKNELLKISKGNEKAYSSLLAEKQAKAAQIRASLFPLAGANPIPFGEAYNYALQAEKLTGVRPAFLLAIFAQESDIDKDATFGKNVGQCYLADPTTGRGIYVKSKISVNDVMKPDRDVKPFLEITKSLGFDPFATVVSCPLSTGGYGGAMGAAQFIPSTWINSIKSRLARLLNISGMPNPWNNSHAFMASSMYLADLGANKRTYTSEKTAALKYYAGSNWNKSKNAFYGNQVMAKAEDIQAMINQL